MILHYIYRNGCALILAALVFAACGQSDDVVDTLPDTSEEPTKRPITFASDVNDQEEQQTRARVPFSEKRTRFVVNGYKHYDDAMTDANKRQKVFSADTLLYSAGQTGTTTDNSSGWYYVHGTQTIKYWDYSAAAYRFVGISGDYTDPEGDSRHRWVYFNVDGKDEDEGYDNTPYLARPILVRKGDGQFGKTVTLSFFKPLVRVRFMLMDSKGKVITDNSMMSDYIDGTSIKFRPTNGTQVAYADRYKFTYNILGDDSYVVEPDPDVVGLTEYHPALTIPYEPTITDPSDDYAFVTEEQKERWWHVLEPESNGSFTLSFTYNGTERKAVVPAEYMQWKMCYAYTYVFKVTDDGVSFSPSLYTYTKWQAGYSEDIEW